MPLTWSTWYSRYSKVLFEAVFEEGRDNLRGIEGALLALKSVREGRFASEVLRGLGNKIALKELSLTSSLVYSVLRREPFWKELFGIYVKKNREGKTQILPPLVEDCLLIGTAGLMELRKFGQGALVNALLDILKTGGQDRMVGMVNAILHNVSRDGQGIMEKYRRSPKMEDRALWAGIPVWSLPAWKKSWTSEDLNGLFELMQVAPSASIRATPGKRDQLWLEIKEGDPSASLSDLYKDAIRIDSTVLPSAVPGFDKGLTTVQTESSMLAASLAAHFWQEGLILDMCSGRGVKAGQIAQMLPKAHIECWELSSGRHLSAQNEMKRLGVETQIESKLGDALLLKPKSSPSMIFLDVPCTGSGTWRRKPESKWKLNWPKFDKICELQSSLLKRALNLIQSGGIIIYATCSLLRQENENVVAEALAEHPNCVALSVPWNGEPFRPGRPWGTYIWPSSPWLDGFYVCIIMKRAEA